MPPKHKTQAERDQMRANLLNAARELFVARGVDAVTMREIAKKIDYSPTTIYHHFKDKEALIQELCITDFKTLGAELKNILEIKAPVARMVALGSAYASFALQHPNHYRMMFMTEKPLNAIDKESVDPSLDAYKILNVVVNDVHAAGHFLPEFDHPELIAQTIWAGIHGVCSLEITMGNDGHISWSDITTRIAFMQTTLIRGLLKESALRELVI